MVPKSQTSSMPQVLERPLPGQTAPTREEKQAQLAKEKELFNGLVAKRNAEQEAKAAPPKKAKVEAPLEAAPEPEKPKAPEAPARHPEVDKELQALRAELAELRSAASPNKAKEPEPEAETYEPEIPDELSSQFGEEEIKGFTALMKPLFERLSKIEGLIENTQKANVEQISKSQRQRLAEKSPILKTSDRAWDALHRSVLEDFEKNPKKYGSLDEAYDSAHKDFYGEAEEPEETPAPEPAKIAAKEKDEETVSRIKASSTTPPGPAKREKRGDVLAASYKAFQHLQKNPGDVNGARGAFRNMIVQ